MGGAVQRQAMGSVTARLCALGLLGVLSALAVLSLAVIGYGKITRSDRDLALINAAQRCREEADHTHDELHADVLEVVRARDLAKADGQRQAIRRLRTDVTEYVGYIAQARAFRLPAPLDAAFASLRPIQLAYAHSATVLADRAQVAPAGASLNLAAFQADFEQLQQVGGRVTEQFARAQEVTETKTQSDDRNAERSIVAAAVLSLLGLIAGTGALVRLGRRLTEVLARERHVAQTLQRSLLPDQLPQLAYATLAARFLPAAAGAKVGGDWYDAIPLPEGGLGLVVGDVTGHDISAAAAMGQLRNALRAWALDGHGPAAVLSRLNAMLFTLQAQHGATCIYLTIDPPPLPPARHAAHTRLVLANAGHCPPLMLSADGEASWLEPEPDPMLGADQAASYGETCYRLERGCTLLLYSDGLVERRGENLEDGLARLLHAAATTAATTVAGALGPDHLCARVLAELFPHRPPDDDVAMLAITLGESGVVAPQNRQQLTPRLSLPEQRPAPRRAFRTRRADRESSRGPRIQLP